MPFLRIEMDRGAGWELRGEGAIPKAGADLAVLRKQLVAYVLQYPHRAVLDGEVVLTVQPARNDKAHRR